MLILSRKTDESVLIGANIEVYVVSIRGDKVRLGFRAPGNVPVHRREIADAMSRDGRQLPELLPTTTVVAP